MLKTILNLKGVEVLSTKEQMKINGGGDKVICIKEWTPYPYYGPCLVLPPIIEVPVPDPLEPFPGKPGVE